MDPSNLPTPQPINHDYHDHRDEDERRQFTIAGHKVSRRDAILASIAVGLLIFGIVMGILGIFSSPSPKTDTSHTDGKQVVDEADLLNHQWTFMPGAVRETDGLRIIPDGFVIVKADGSGGQPNPPINLYGTYLEEVKDITITATITPGKSELSLRLYTEPPIITDYFREERKSIDLGINGNVLSISTWDGAEPVTNTYTFDANNKVTLAVTRQNRILTFTVNGKQVATLPEGNIFSSGKLWFGANATIDSWTLNSLHAEALNNSRVTVADASKVITKQATDSLQVLATKKRQGFLLGTALALGPLVSDREYRNVALGQFGVFTPENVMKWQYVHPADNDYDFAEADAFADVAQKNGLVMHGHSLIEGEALPPWVHALPIATDADKQRVEAIMLDHIKTVGERYKGKVASWDVIDEPLASSGPDYKNHKWFQATGKAYIIKALMAARQADPQAQLFINEYGLEKDGPRWEAFLNLVGELKRQNAPLDGVGLQAHIGSATDKVDAAVLRKHIQQLKSLDLKVRISEMTVYAAEGPENQASQYTTTLDACLQESTCVSFTTWGVGNRYNYYKDAQAVTRRGEDLLYNLDLKPTAAANAVRDLLSR